jgi:hypothetical protein
MIDYKYDKRPSFIDIFIFLKPYKIYHEDKLDILE